MNDFRKLFEQTSAVETQSEGTSFRAKFDQAQAMSNAGDINGIMSLVSANISDPEEAQAVAGMTYTLAKTYNQKPIDILKDLDGWAARYNGATQPRKTAWKQIQDGFVSGWYTDQLGTIGSALMYDQKPEIRQMYLDRVAEIRARMPNTEGDKGNIAVKALSSASNMLGTMVRPFLTNLAVSSLIPAIKLPMVATELAGAVPAIAKKVASHAISFGTTWAVTADVEAGNIYLDMLDNGVDEDIAKKYARIHGAIAGALEAAPLEFAFTRFPFLKGATQSAWKKLATNTRAKQAMVKALGGILQKNLISYSMQELAEVGTEALQEVSSISFERKAALALADEVKDEKLKKMLPEVYNEWRDLYNKEVEGRQALYEGKDYKEYVADRVWDVVVQTALGTAVLGFVGAAGQVISDARYTSTLRKEAEVDPSKFHFIKKHFTDEQMKDIKPGERKETLAQIYDTHHAGEATVDNINPKTIDADYVPINEDVEDEEQAQASSTPTQPIKRRKDNRLHTQEMIGNDKNPGVIRHSDGSESHTLLLGTTDTSARKNNRYGYIDYTISADGRSVKLDSVNMKPGYEDLTGEFVTELMRRYPGLEIEWSPEADSQKAIKEQLIKGNTENPGKLQMFKRDQSDMDRILKVAGYIKEIAPKMDSDKAAVFAEVLDIRARRRGVSLDEYLGHYLKFMSVEQGIKEGRFTEQELKDIKGKKGAFKPMIDAVEGIVFVGEEGDFSTFAHETWHGAVVADPESAKEFADAIKNGIAKNQKGFRKYLSDHATIMAGSGVLTPDNKLDIDRAISELSNMDADPTKWNTAQNELSARLFETALQEGRTFDPEMKSIMDKIVDFFLKIYRLLKQRSMLNDDIVKAMDKIFLGNPELKAKAEATQTQRQETSFQDTTPAERAEADRQYKEIEAQYKGTDQWMKAPNGKPTKLTERQWVQVRTPNFKKWFGDWINDPANASKVVDENGEPRVVYHGTLSARRFTKFDPKKGYNINAIWHASNIDVSAHWSGTSKITRFDKTLNKKLKSIKEWANLEKFAREELGIEIEHGSDESGKYWFDVDGVGHGNVNSETDVISDVKERLSEYVEDAQRSVASQVYGTQTFTYADFINLRNPLIADAQGKSYHDIVYNGEKVNGESLSSIAQEQGNDGVIINNVLETDYENIKTDTFITFSPEQIKSATDNIGTFSQSNPSILFQTEQQADFQQRVIAAQDFRDEAKDYGHRVKINWDGSITLYHGTSKENADSIQANGINAQSYFGYSEKEAEYYAKKKHKNGVAIKVAVDPRDIEFAAAGAEIYTPNELKFRNGMYTSQPDTFSDNPSILFQTDTEYLDAVNSGDMAKAQAMVDARAREMGYNSPKLYHGTNAFGFTGVDTENKSDDGLSFWATSNPRVAGTYTQINKVREIKSELSEEDIEEIREKREAELDEAIDNFRDLIDSTFSEWVFGREDDSYIKQQVMEANPEIGEGDGVYDVLVDMVADAFYNYQDELEELQEYEDFAEWQDSFEFEQIATAIVDVESARTALNEIDKGNVNGGIYQLYAKTDNMYVLDAKGETWNGLRSDDFPKLKRPWSEDAPYKTRDVVQWAKEQGYDGVIFKNIRDNGQYGRTEPADVYAFIRPKAQLKSADPVTYDDNGQVIPLSQRFNDSHSSLLFQSAYHGSGASFDKFDTNYMGTGEGSQTFGWGIYLSKSKTIAKDYAERRGYERYKEWDEDEWTPANQLPIENKIYRVMRHQSDTYGMTFDDARKYLIDFDEKVLDTYKGKDINALEGVDKEVYEETKEELERLKNAKESNITVASNLYTATIPDDTGSNYLYWDRPVKAETIKKVAKALDEQGIELDFMYPDNLKTTEAILKYAIKELPDRKEAKGKGEGLYDILEESVFESDKEASQFLNSIGFVGIDYPANTFFGGRTGTRNFVIFNADDITIDTHTMWQEKTPQEIENEQIAEAKGQTLDGWLDYNRFMGDEDIDEEALKAIWEKANNVTETPEGTKIVNTENLTEEEKDNAFQAIIDSEDGVRRVIEDIRQAIQFKNEVQNTGASDEEEQYRTEAIRDAQADLETTAAKIIKSVVFSKEKEIDEQAVKSIQGIMRKNLAEYRELYSQFTGREELAMSNDALPFIDEPTRAAIATMTISQKRKYLEEVADEKLTESFLKGKELREGETERVIKHLKEKMADKDKDIAEAQEELKNATKRISSRDQMLLKEVGKREELENQVNKLSAKIRAKLDKGNKISEEEYRKLNTAQEKLDNINEMLKELRKQDKAKEALRWSEKIAKSTAERKETERRLRAAQKLSDYKKSLVDNITRKIPKTVNWEQAEKIQAIQAVFGRPSQYDNEYITYKGKKMLLKEFKAGIEDGSINVEELSDYQLRRYLNKDIAEYSVEELEIMADTVRYLIQTGRQAWQAKIDARNYEAKQWQSLIMNQIARSPRYTNASDTPLPGTAEDIKKERNLLQMIRTGWFKTLNMARKAQMLDGDRKAVAYRLLVEEYRDHLRNELEAIRRRQKPVKDLMEKLGVKPKDFYNDTYRLNIGGHEQTYNLSQIIYGVKAQMEQRNMEAFVYGNLFNANEKPEGVNRLWLEKQGETRLAEFNRQAQEILKDKENIMKVADAIWADWQNRDNFNRLNQAAIDEYNQAVDPVAFYMPIARLDFNGTELASKIADDLYNQNAGKGMTSVEKGMIKSRITIAPENQMPIDMDYFKLWNESVNDQEHFIETNAYIRKLNRVFKARGSKDLKATIENVFGQGMMNDINNYINEIANPDTNTDTQGVNKFITFLRGALYPAYLAFKASSVILQMITSPAPFLREVGPLELVKGLVQMSLHPVETWRYVSGLSAIMENRSMNPMVEEAKKAAQRYTDPKYKRLWHKIQEKGTMGLEMADKWSVTAGWLAVFTKQKDKLIAEGMEEAQAEREAVKYADNVVLETQPTGDKAELAPLFKVGGPAWQAFTQFQVSLNVIWNNLSYDVLFSDRINHEKRKAMGTLIGYAMAGMILYATQEGFDDDDDAEDVILKLLYGATTQYTSSIPLVSSSIDNMIRARMTGDNWISKSNQLYPGFDALMQGVTNLDWKKVLRGAAIMGGVPMSGWKEFEHSFYNRKTGELRFYPQAFLGRRETNKKK